VSLDKVKSVNRVSVGDLQVSDDILKKIVESTYTLISGRCKIGIINDSEHVENELPNCKEEISAEIKPEKLDLVRKSNEIKLEILKSCAIRSLSSFLESRVLCHRLAQIIRTETLMDANIQSEFLNNLISIANADSKSNGISDIPMYEEYLLTLNMQRQKLLVNEILKKLSPPGSKGPLDSPEAFAQSKSPKSSEKIDSYLRLHDDKEPSNAVHDSKPRGESGRAQFTLQRSVEQDERPVDRSTVDLLENMGFPRRWCEIALQLCGLCEACREGSRGQEGSSGAALICHVIGSVVVTITMPILILENCFHGVIFGALFYAFEFGMRGFPRPVYRAHVQIMRFYNAPFNVAITLEHLGCNIFEKGERQPVKCAPLKWKHLFHMNVFAVIETPRSVVS
jgi:hypothetical protein